MKQISMFIVLFILTVLIMGTVSASINSTNMSDEERIAEWRADNPDRVIVNDTDVTEVIDMKTNNSTIINRLEVPQVEQVEITSGFEFMIALIGLLSIIIFLISERNNKQ